MKERVNLASIKDKLEAGIEFRPEFINSTEIAD